MENYISSITGQWTIDGFKQHVKGLTAATANLEARTLSAIQRKLGMPGRIPKWVDSQPQSYGGLLQTGQPAFQVADLIQPHQVSILRIDASGGGREYALLLSHVLDSIGDLAARHRLACPVLIVIDEAQDIFSASKHFQTIAISMLDRNVRKGRSKRIGYVFGVQSAQAVPDSILNNLNNRIIHRHNSVDELRVAAAMASDNQRAMTATFAPGEALTYLFGSTGVVHAKMRRSPFMLTKEDL
jgi:hypothetical protein